MVVPTATMWITACSSAQCVREFSARTQSYVRNDLQKQPSSAPKQLSSVHPGEVLFIFTSRLPSHKMTLFIPPNKRPSPLVVL